MPHVEIRLKAGVTSPGDLRVTISDKTFDHLMTATDEKVRVSTYLDQDWPRVETQYEELFVNAECTSRFKIVQITPGSKTRWTITLPDAMRDGEQITLHVMRERIF